MQPLIFILVLLVYSSTATELVLKGSPRPNPNWQIYSTPEPSARSELFIALPLHNLDNLEQYALKISDLNSPMFGKQLSYEQIKTWTSPRSNEVNRVLSWLRRHGLTDEEITVTDSRGWIRLDTTIEKAEKFLHCKFRLYKHISASKFDKVLRCEDAYYVDSDVAPFIQFVAPVHGFPRLSSRLGKRVSQSGLKVTPSVIRHVYNVSVGTPNYSKYNNTQAVLELEDDYSTKDLQEFFRKFQNNLIGQKIVKELGDLPNDPTNPGSGEAALDVQYIMAIGSFAPTYYYNYRSGSSDNDLLKAFLKWTIELANDPKPPLVHSVSYGLYNGDYPFEMVKRISDEWMLLTTRGLTIFFASGDDGVGCNSECTHMEFPYPSSPWITLVGATSLNKDEFGSYWEKGSSFSSGGFSENWPMPAWQSEAVNWYLNNCPTVPDRSWFNVSGRALPDIAALGENVQIILGGNVSPIGGTSASSPIVAGLISLVNGARLQMGKKPLGFLNPLLYTAAKTIPNAFYDVTEGNNSDGCCPGFDAYKGWDPVTGLGTPNFVVLAKYLIQNVP
jgi:tripeptidyl-peptidase-1